jgi:hypothetical protein
VVGAEEKEVEVRCGAETSCERRSTSGASSGRVATPRGGARSRGESPSEFRSSPLVCETGRPARGRRPASLGRAVEAAARGRRWPAGLKMGAGTSAEQGSWVKGTALSTIGSPASIGQVQHGCTHCAPPCRVKEA